MVTNHISLFPCLLRSKFVTYEHRQFRSVSVAQPLFDAIRLHIEDRIEMNETIPTMESISLTSLEVAV